MLRTITRLDPSHRLAAVAALCLLYLTAFFTFGPRYFTVPAYSWPDTLVALATAALLAVAARHSGGSSRVFFALLSVSLVCVAVTEATYLQGLDVIERGSEEPGSVWMIAYTLALFSWVCAWGLLALRLFRTSPATRLTTALSALLLLGLSLIFFNFYLHQGLLLSSVQDRFLISQIVLGVLGLILALICVLLGIGRALALMVAGYSTFIASDFIFIALEHARGEREVTALDPLWMAGEFLLLAGALVLPQLVRPAEAGGSVPAEGEADDLRTRSGLSGLLVLLVTGAVFVVGLLMELIPADGWRALVLVLFVVTCVMLMTRLTVRFDSAVLYARRWIGELLHRLDSDDWRPEGHPVLHRTLKTTGLAALLEHTARAAGELRREVLFLGPERLNRPAPQPRAGGGPVRCFLIMPFRPDWAEAVQRTLRDACRRHGVHAVRGDDSLVPTDILDDIWVELTSADFVIADISGQNPNVYYELGMAHTLAKPVILLSQSTDDVPFDVQTRRVVEYDPQDLEALAERLNKGIAGLLKTYGLGEAGEPRPS